MRSFAVLRMTFCREEKRGEKKAAQPPSFPSYLQTTGCHPERRHGAKDLVLVIGFFPDKHILVCLFY
jgi:hypothetical protein